MDMCLCAFLVYFLLSFFSFSCCFMSALFTFLAFPGDFIIIFSFTSSTTSTINKLARIWAIFGMTIVKGRPLLWTGRLFGYFSRDWQRFVDV